MTTDKPGKFLPFLAVLILAGCNSPTPGTDVPPNVTPSVTPIPTRTPDPFPDPTLVINGAEELVFDWSAQRCEDFNFADLPARAFRDADGQVQLILSDNNNYRMIGPDLNSVRLDCDPVMRSQNSADPSLFSDNEWIASPYTEDGRTVYALVHNEYWGHTHSGRCPQQDYFPCWDNSITLAISTDGGKTYAHAAEPPAHLVARLPYPYVAGDGPAGIRSPSNIILGVDGFYYSFVNVVMPTTQDQHVCLMRTENLGDAGSWRYWDGSGFEGKFINPYVDAGVDPADHLCAALEWNDIGASLNDSLSYNTYLGRYVLTGLSADHIDGREVWGIYYSFSKDLVRWTRRKLLTEMPLPWTVPNAGTDVSYLYPSLLDPLSESRNFETSGKTAYLYYTRNNHGHGSLDRDLLRVPVEFLPQP